MEQNSQNAFEYKVYQVEIHDVLTSADAFTIKTDGAVFQAHPDKA